MSRFVPSFSCNNYQNFQEPQTRGSKAEHKNPTMEAGKFKTKLCHYFMTTGKCHYGAKCHFAHGQHELRRSEDAGPLIHPRHKTTLCQNELRHGVCKFGKVCMFIHKEDPEYKMLQKQMLDHQSLRSSPEPTRASDPVEPTTNEQSVQPKSILSGLFVPIKKVFQEIKEPTSFIPGTPLTSDRQASADSVWGADRRASAASVWGALSPRVAVWEKHLRGAIRI